MKHAVAISLSLASVALGCASQPALEPDAPVAPVVVDVDDKPAKADAKTKADEQAERDRKIAENAGILARLKDSGDASLFGASSALGDDAEDALGGLIGEPIGEAYGAGGLGLSGVGRGGGGAGTAGGGIGLGRIGTIRRGQGGGASGYGSGIGRLDRKGQQPPQVRAGSAAVSGKLGKEVIRRIIRARLRQIRYCYEKRLQVNPTLSAKVTVRFVIGKTGKVVAASMTKASSDKKLDSCLVKAFQRMRFPKPDNGGVVSVSYPLVFKPATTAPKSKPAKKPAGKASTRPSN